MNILAFGASYHKNSINKAFASYVSRFFQEGNELDVLDLNQFELPIFTVDLEDEIGHPPIIEQFLERLGWADLIILSMAEHNGAYTAAFKNLLDWSSRVQLEMFEGSKMFLLSTSPGSRGGESVLQIAADRFPRHGATILDTFSLPSFDRNYSYKEGITNEELLQKLLSTIENVKKKLEI